MKYNIDEKLNSYYNIRVMLKGIPRSLWKLLLPVEPEGLDQMEMNILAFKVREVERNRVMALQKICDFSLRPNASLRETLIRARLQGWKKKKMTDRFNNKDDQNS
ncbi:MAG: hypothetical protein PHU88_02160 [candidate division Zixibacteria bacterium]|nr:hypothetical protein [candidate division Zixibacteria bacterium]MDD5425279.1 hypothetical protein [candidate division Zixibacteria bacterium]